MEFQGLANRGDEDPIEGGTVYREGAKHERGGIHEVDGQEASGVARLTASRGGD